MTEPKLISRPTPVMPAIAKTRGIYGTVKIEATVDKQGNVTNVKVMVRKPDSCFVARDAVIQSKYQPGTLNGQPTDVPVEIQIVFKEGKRLMASHPVAQIGGQIYPVPVSGHQVCATAGCDRDCDGQSQRRLRQIHHRRQPGL